MISYELFSNSLGAANLIAAVTEDIDREVFPRADSPWLAVITIKEMGFVRGESERSIQLLDDGNLSRKY
jgi:hypothetical protein